MASDRWVVLDDNNTSIKYTGSWFQDASKDNIGNFGPPYLHTLHGTSTNGTISVEFNGTGIQAWGTNIDQDSGKEPVDPTFECFVDNISISKGNLTQTTENNLPVCNQDGLPDGPHKLRIDVTVISPNHTFWFDQIRYLPSPTLPLDDKVILFDYLDPAITYDSSWTDWPAGLGRITMQTNAAVLVNFIGTSISWMSFTPTERPHTSAMATWSIDGGDPNQFILQGLPNDNSANTAYNQIYFVTPEAQQGLYTLNVTFLGSDQTTPLGINSLFVKNGTFQDDSTITSAVYTQASASTTQSQVPNTQSLTTPSKMPLGKILGSIIGGLALLLLILVGGYLYWRRWLKEWGKGPGCCPTPYDDWHLSPGLFSDTMAQHNQYQTHPSSRPLKAMHLVTTTPEQQPSGRYWRKQQEVDGEAQSNTMPLPAYVPSPNLQLHRNHRDVTCIHGPFFNDFALRA